MMKPTHRLLSACWSLLLTAPLVLTACYRSHTITAIPGSGGHVWTGTGRIGELGSSELVGRALGLAGRDLWWSPDFRRSTTPAGSIAPGDYVLTGLAQTVMYGGHEETWLHLAPVSGERNLALHRAYGVHFESLLAFPMASGAGVIDSGVSYTITQVCDLAGVEEAEVGGGHLFASVTACTGGSTCAGGVVEVSPSRGGVDQWRVLNPTGAQQATIRGRVSMFPAECLPIATTGRDPFTTQLLAVVSPAQRDLLVYRVGAMHSGPMSAVHVNKPGYRPIDVVVLRRAEAVSYLAVLWKSATEALLEHYLVTDGAISPILTEPLAPTTLFIESPGFVRGTALRDVFAFAPEQVERRQYDLSAR